MAAQSKEIGIIGVGSMGGNIATLLYEKGYSLVLYNKTADKLAQFKGMENIFLSDSPSKLADRLRKSSKQVVIWSMVPGGAVTNGLMSELSGIVGKGDIVIDGSNSTYEDSMANYAKLKANGASYLDVGCAGGPDDLLKGVSLMVGGDKEAFTKVKDIFKIIAGKGAYGYVGSAGAGHKAKLVHNGIFYGIFPVYAEGIELLVKIKDSDPKSTLDINETLRLLSAAPPINTAITEAIAEAFEKGTLPATASEIKISEMVKWESEKAKQLGVQFSITRGILDGCKGMSEKSRIIYAAAKKIVTGH